MCGARSSSARYRRVRLGRAHMAAHGRVDVAQQLERASGRRVERGGFAKVPERGAQLAAAAIAVATLECASIESCLRASAPLKASIAS